MFKNCDLQKRKKGYHSDQILTTFYKNSDLNMLIVLIELININLSTYIIEANDAKMFFNMNYTKEFTIPR